MVGRREFIKAITVLGVFAYGGSMTVQAQSNWPTSPVKIVVPVAPGGTADRISRQIGAELSKSLGEPFVVENVSGGGGVIATQRVATAKPDGNTFMLSYSATHSTNPAVRSVPYDPVREFTPIAMIGGTPNVLVVGKDFPASDLKVLIKLLKEQPDKFSYGSAGSGTLTHLAMEQFRQATGTDMTHIPYRGGSPLMTALLGGQVNLGFPSLSTAIGNIQAGLLKPIVVTSNERHPLLPDVPTLVEVGLVPDGSFQWYGFHGPAGIPPDVLSKLNNEINKIIKSPDFQKMLADGGVEAMPMSQEAFAEFARKDKEVWANLAKTANITVD